MSSIYSTITNNVNMLLVDSSTITNFSPYVAYISSVNIPGRIATVRDSTGLVSTPGRIIIVSTLKDVLFADGTSSIRITQPFGYITMSARDKSTWNIVNTFAFPNPEGNTNVSSIYTNGNINTKSLFCENNISTPFLNVHSISSVNLQASTISTGLLLANRISTNIIYSFNSLLSNISSATISTTNIFASLLSTNRLKTNDIGTSTVTFNSGVQNSVLSLSNDGQALLVNGIPTGTFRSISTATTNLNMNNFSISNVNNINTANLAVTNVVATNLTATNMFTNLIDVNSISSINIKANNISTNLIDVNSISSINIKANNISTNTIKTNSINVSSIAVYDAFTNNYLNPINASNGNLYINNQLITSSIINNGVLDNCNNDISNVNNIYAVTTYTNNIYPLTGLTDLVINTSLNMSNFSIKNLLQTTNINDATTNNIISKYSLITTNLYTSNVGVGAFNIITESDTPFTLNTLFSKYKFTFYFRGTAGIFLGSDIFFFCLLSNTNTGELYSGSNVGSNTGNPIYPIVVPPYSYNPAMTIFQYSDVFTTNGTADSLSVLLYGAKDGADVVAYSLFNFYMTYEPLLL